MKKRWLMGMALALAVGVCACSGGSSATPKKTAEEMAGVMLESREDSENPMDSVSAKQAAALYGIAEGQAGDMALYMGQDNMKCDELAVVIPAEGKTDEVETLLKERLQTQLDSFEGYAPEEFARLEETGSVSKQGGYVVYVAGSSSQQMLDALKEATK